MKELIYKVEKTIMDELLRICDRTAMATNPLVPRARKASLELEKMFKEYRKLSIEATKK